MQISLKIGRWRMGGVVHKIPGWERWENKISFLIKKYKLAGRLLARVRHVWLLDKYIKRRTFPPVLLLSIISNT
jgi:hypothetical protein